MRKLSILMLALMFSFCFGAAAAAQGQQSSPEAESGRKVVKRVSPQYPEMAKKMNLGGTVKVVALVATDGNVKKVEPVGGSPLLVQAAQVAISQWKYSPGPESRESIELHFTP